MTRRQAGRMWLLAGLLVAASAAQAQELDFIEPVGGTVRGTVPILVSMSAGYKTGFVSFYVGPAGEPLRFKMAAVANVDGLFGFEWETQKQGRRQPDGEYRILAVGFNAGGEVVGQKAISVVVQNEVASPARGILLRHNLTPGREANYRGSSRISVASVGGAEEAGIQMFRGGVRADWRSRILWRNADGRATVRNSIHRFFEITAREHFQPLDADGRFLSLMMEPDGRLLHREQFSQVEFPFAELTMEFPEEPQKVGDTWRSPMTVLVAPRSQRVEVVPGQHTLSSIEWHAGYRSAVIDSEFEGGPYRVVLKGEDEENEEWLAGVTIIVKGKRRTYFAYQPEVGRVLRVEEQQEQHCTLELVEEPEVVGGEMGMGMEGGDMMGMPMPGADADVIGGSVPGAMPGGSEGMSVEGMAGETPTETVEKPAGFEQGGRAFKRVNPKAASSSTAGSMTGESEGMPTETAPPEVTVVHFRRQITTDIHQDFLDPRAQ